MGCSCGGAVVVVQMEGLGCNGGVGGLCGQLGAWGCSGGIVGQLCAGCSGGVVGQLCSGGAVVVWWGSQGSMLCFSCSRLVKKLQLRTPGRLVY